MSAELEIAYGVSGRTLYSVIRNSVGAVWNGASFVAYNGANWTTYAVAMTEQGTSGYYTGDFPAVAAGTYNVETRDRAGGAAATTDPLAGSGSLSWDGTAVVVVPTTTTILASSITELASIPNPSPTLSQALALLYMTLRNQITVDAANKKIHNDAGATLATKALTDTGALYTEAKMA